MAYALGRRVEYYDQPRVREIVEEASGSDYRMSAFILGVVRSPAFQMKAGAGTEPAATVAVAAGSERPGSGDGPGASRRRER